ncbi:hypothetical protein [Seohaeicola zhoushanensis]|uniref:Lipopolysaccharide export system protein LptC n=1 Tax=Seohaeicola zhoushanensis TaxID=1569283 RepID=A0A8J3MA03_9RHOB|nr:hypothetical protein [Seohaeicola zhoushanensis]GHF65685.1 hypothetical protein GCM10017056_41010 [Seohaeicola zhoushanensis]
MDLYSRMVAFFKVLLPLLALAILATLFLISRGVNFDAKIPFAENEVADRLRTQQITAPFFSGTTPNGDEVTVRARIARPGTTGAPAEAEEVQAKMTRSSGEVVTLDSNAARVDIEEDMATFTGEVKIETSTGFTLNTEVLNTSLHGVSGSAPGPVSGVGPFGTLNAGQMEFGPKNEGEPVQLLFKQGVKLVYQPKITEK